jgi:predicted nucleotidyltransferase
MQQWLRYSRPRRIQSVMHQCVEHHLPRLRELCRLFHVTEMHLFGSAVEGLAPADFDFAVRFSPCTPTEHYERYFGLLEALQATLNAPVDLIELQAIRNPFFARRIQESRVTLYAA